MIGELVFLDGLWYWTSRRFATEHQARVGLDAIHDSDVAEVGVFRHGVYAEPAVFVTAVGLKREQVEKAEAVIGPCDHHPGRDVLNLLVARRIRFVADMDERGARPGNYLIRRARGARMRPDGSTDELIGRG